MFIVVFGFHIRIFWRVYWFRFWLWMRRFRLRVNWFRGRVSRSRWHGLGGYRFMSLMTLVIFLSVVFVECPRVVWYYSGDIYTFVPIVVFADSFRAVSVFFVGMMRRWALGLMRVLVGFIRIVFAMGCSQWRIEAGAPSAFAGSVIAAYFLKIQKFSDYMQNR